MKMLKIKKVIQIKNSKKPNGQQKSILLAHKQNQELINRHLLRLIIKNIY